MKWFCRHNFVIYNDMYTVHVWSVESFPQNNVYRYEFSYCVVHCPKCGKYKVNHKMKLLDHGSKNSKNVKFVDINMV